MAQESKVQAKPREGKVGGPFLAFIASSGTGGGLMWLGVHDQSMWTGVPMWIIALIVFGEGLRTWIDA